jgi:hypothetical protein
MHKLQNRRKMREEVQTVAKDVSGQFVDEISVVS